MHCNGYYRARRWLTPLGMFVLSTLLIGCAQPGQMYWVAFDGAKRNVAQDEHACRAAAAQKVTPYPDDPLSFAWVPMDQTAYRDCMEHKGYQLYVEGKPLERDRAATVTNVASGEQTDARIELAVDRSAGPDEAEKGCEAIAGEFGETTGCVQFLNVGTAYSVVLTPSAGQHAAILVNSRPTVLPIPAHP